MQRHLRCAALAAILLSASRLYATEEPDSAEVVVTATRFSEKSLESPIGVQIISSTDIEHSTATSVSEVLSKLGGVQTRVSGLGLPDTPLDLRGFGVTGDQNTLVLINGVRISENEQVAARISTIPLNAIDRIEIQRGSGAVLYGAGATAGVINIITRPAIANKTTGRVFATAGSYGSSELRADLATGGSAWGINLTASSSDSDGYRHNNQTSSDNASGELRVDGSSGWAALRINADKQHVRTPGIRSQTQLSTDPRGTGNPNDYGDIDSTQGILSGEYRLSDSVTLSADASLRDKVAQFFSQSLFGTVFNDTHVNVLTLSPRVKWRSDLGGMENVLITGVDLADWTYHTGWQATGFFFSRNENGTQRNNAIYVQDQLRLTPALRLSLGVRQESVKQASAESLTPLPRSSKTHDLDAHDIGLRYEWSESIALLARSGRSYRIANVDDNRCFFPPCAPFLQPQTSRDNEIGAEWKRSDAHLRLSLFESKLRNEIYYNNLIFTNTNLSPTKRQGIELDGGFNPSANWDLGARYFYTRARFDQGVYGGIDVSGKEVPLVPKQRAAFTAGWQQSADTRLTASATYVGSQSYDNDPANLFHKMPSYTLVDFKVAHRIGQLKLSGGVNNLFDKKYYSYALVNSSTAPTTFSAYPETPRTAYVSAEYAW